MIGAKQPGFNFQCKQSLFLSVSNVVAKYVEGLGLLGICVKWLLDRQWFSHDNYCKYSSTSEISWQALLTFVTAGSPRKCNNESGTCALTTKKNSKQRAITHLLESAILATTKGDNYKSFFFFRFRFGKTTDVFRTNTTTGVKIIWKLNTRIAQEKNQNWPMTHEKYFFHSPTTDKINIEKIRPPTQKKIDCRPTPPFGHFWNSP